MGTTRITAEPGQPYVDMEREFEAPAALLLRAYTEPELLVQWLGPRRLTMRVEQFEARHGGAYRYVHTDTDGSEYGFRGVFHGTPSVEGITQTFEYEGAPGHVSLDSLTFEERDGRTVMRGRSVFQSVEDRDAMVGAGMEHGVREGYERLDELLDRMRSPLS